MPLEGHGMKKRLVRSGRRLALSASALLGTHRWFRPRAEASASVLLFHRFFEPGEPHKKGIERLRRQLAWLRQRYTPVSLPRFVQSLESGSLPHRAVLVTSDDALTDILHVVDEFKAFDVPLSAFVCAGWTAAASQGTGADLMARAAAAIQWHEGPDVEFRLGSGRSIHVSPPTKAKVIDQLIVERDEWMPDLEELSSRLERLAGAPYHCCTWSELQTLVRAGVSMGAHSVTHIRMSQASSLRRHFEINESKRLCEAMLGPCHTFAYPYGMDGTHCNATRAELRRAGYEAAFLTHSDFITAKSDKMTLPRISMPDGAISQREFQARASGAGIVMRRLGTLMRPGRSHVVVDPDSILPLEEA
jgi:peptidoglycan/xylan/chitin deacetylase (PgdA/CDA1 family)